MTDSDPTKNQSTNLSEEFAKLGRNIKQALQSAWSSEERKKLQAEIETGLMEASRALKQASGDFSKSQAAQTLKADTEDFKKRVHSGELEAKIRSEVMNALHIANEALKNAFPSESAKGGEPSKPSKTSKDQ